MIISKSKDGNNRRVICNENLILVDSEDSLSFEVNDAKLNLDLTFNFTFSDDGEELRTSGTFSDDGKIVNITLHKWNNPAGAELTKPIELTTTIGMRVWVKFKTYADKKNSFRSFHLTIWGEE